MVLQTLVIKPGNISVFFTHFHLLFSQITFYLQSQSLPPLPISSIVKALELAPEADCQPTPAADALATESIIKHSTNFAAINQDFLLDVSRCVQNSCSSGLAVEARH